MAEGASETQYHNRPETQFGTSACPPQTGVWGEKRLRVSDAFNRIVASETQYHNRPETQFGTSTNAPNSSLGRKKALRLQRI
jgi:hypothetical protein